MCGKTREATALSILDIKERIGEHSNHFLDAADLNTREAHGKV